MTRPRTAAAVVAAPAGILHAEGSARREGMRSTLNTVPAPAAKTGDVIGKSKMGMGNGQSLQGVTGTGRVKLERSVTTITITITAVEMVIQGGDQRDDFRLM